MTTDISITIKPADEKNDAIINAEILKSLDKKGIPFKKDDVTSVFVKKSIDARHGQIKILLRYKVYIGEKPNGDGEFLPTWKKADGKHTVIIVGSGPAGLYAAFRLLEDGIKPILVERGSCTDERKVDVTNLENEGKLNAQSNFCFGEGGAGTFSDGKLYTRSNKRGDIGKIYRIFVEFGAPERIMTDAHPHIGTDKLPGIISGMRKKIIELGGEFYFDTLCTDLIIEEKSNLTVKGIRTKNLKTGQESQLSGDAVILATGHSAIDIYKMIAKISPESLEAKTFAVGVRVEHPRSLIDSIQFHGKTMPEAAEYRLTTQVDGRGVYSFCMCPGGFVIPAATDKEQIVVNGMSPASRGTAWSNSGMVVEVRPEDLGEEADVLKVMRFQEQLEKTCWQQGNMRQTAPAQRMADFVNGKLSYDLPKSSYAPGLISSPLHFWMPKMITHRLQEGFRVFGRNAHGFLTNEAVMIAVETRTSSPVRIVRDRDTLQHVRIEGLFPCGEGAGYAGGIVSAGVDGERCAEMVAQYLKK